MLARVGRVHNQSARALAISSQVRHASDKGAYRDPARLQGLGISNFAKLMETRDETMKKIDSWRDEDGVVQWPHPMEFPYMTYHDVKVNYHIRARGFVAPEFSEAEYKEIAEKTTLNKDSVEYVRDMWCNRGADDIDYIMIRDDIHEMYKKGVSKRTINLYLDHITGHGSHHTDSFRNLNWTRIDS